MKSRLKMSLFFFLGLLATSVIIRTLQNEAACKPWGITHINIEFSYQYSFAKLILSNNLALNCSIMLYAGISHMTLLPKSWLPVHQCRNEIRRQFWRGKKGWLILCQAKGGTQQASSSRSVPPPWGTGRGLIVGARGQGYAIRIKAVTVLHSSFFCRVSKGWGC